jgi:hypothetical protein
VEELSTGEVASVLEVNERVVEGYGGMTHVREDGGDGPVRDRTGNDRCR